jgi:hypothetical protein
MLTTTGSRLAHRRSKPCRSPTARNPNTDEGREDLAMHASALMRGNRAIQHVLIRQGGRVIGEIANASGDGDGFDDPPLQ